MECGVVEVETILTVLDELEVLDTKMNLSGGQ
jgi:hypothetical protein